MPIRNEICYFSVMKAKGQDKIDYMKKWLNFLKGL